MIIFLLMNNKGIAFETLAKMAIVVLILVTVTVFFAVGMQRLASQFSDTASTDGAALTSARTTCTTYCMSMNNILADAGNAISQPYCNRIFYLEEDGDSNDKDHCYDELITGGTPCTVTLSSGQTVEIGLNACRGGDTGGGIVIG
jgi:hypothetical protein